MTSPVLERLTFAPQGASAFTVGPGVARISLAWWAEGDPDPVFVRGSLGLPVTVVVVWPTDPRGMLYGDRLDNAEWSVQPWHVDERAFGKLRELHVDWPWNRHDLWIGPGRFGPCASTLRTWPGFTGQQVVARVIEQVQAGRARR